MLATRDLAYYKVGNVAGRAWRDVEAAARLQGLVAAIAADGGLFCGLLARIAAWLEVSPGRLRPRRGTVQSVIASY